MSASVRARLMNVAKLKSEAFDLVLVRFAIERLLYRLSRSKYRDRFVVKGAMMFQVWSNLTHRPTRDLDLLGTGEPDIDRFVYVFRELCVQAVEDDGLIFMADSVSATKLKEDEEYEGIRVRFDAKLGSARIPIQVDIGFGDAITPESVLIDFPTVLELPAPKLQSYPRETVVAEKFQAMVMLGIANSRMKDFFDLFTLCSQFEFDGELIRRAIKATKRGHKTCPRPSLPAEEVERFVVAQLQSLTIDETLLNETSHRVSRTINDKGDTLRKELSLLNESLVNLERAIEAISIPTGDDAREVKRLDSLASLTEQQTRDLRRRSELQDQLAKIQAGAPDRFTIMNAIKNLQGLWEHLTMGERSRLMTQLVTSIDHDPSDSTLSITLSPIGLKSFATNPTDSYNQSTSNRK